MRLPYDLVVVDLEANQPSSKIIEIGAVKLLRDGGIHPKHFSQLVKIDEPLGSCQTRQGEMTITELTGITQDMLDKGGISFPEALKKFREWSITETKNIVLASWGVWDASCLRDNCNYHNIGYPFRGKTLDVKSMLVMANLLFQKKWKSDGLSSMMKAWEQKFIGSKHRATDDAHNTALLLQKVWFHKRDYDKKILSDLAQVGTK